MKKLFTSVAKTESIILRDWSDNQSKGYFTGVILDACEVFSICDGVVVQVEKSIEYFQVVTIQYSVNLYIRYLNIVELADNIAEGNTIRYGQLIGRTHRDNACIEICVTNTKSHKWPVRIGRCTLYKVDPIPYLTDETIFHKHSTVRVITDDDLLTLPHFELTDGMKQEFNGDNRGEY